MCRARMQGNGNTWQSSPGYRLIHDYARKLPGVELMTVQTGGSLATSFVDGRKIESTLKHTDAEFWRVYQFAFLEGSPYGACRRRVGAPRRRDQRDQPQALLRRPAGRGPLHRRRRPALPGDRRRQGRAVDAHAVGRPVRAAHRRRSRRAGRRSTSATSRRPSCSRPTPDPRTCARSCTRAWRRGSRPRPRTGRRCRQRSRRPSKHGRADLYPGDTDFTRTYGGFLTMMLAGAALMFMAAAGDQPREPERQPHHGARVRDRRPQGLRRLEPHAGRAVRRREPGADGHRRPHRLPAGRLRPARRSTRAA